jgi:glycosyltransferase involved in cell wall biosynthesis
MTTSPRLVATWTDPGAASGSLQAPHRRIAAFVKRRNPTLALNLETEPRGLGSRHGHGRNRDGREDLGATRELARADRERTRVSVTVTVVIPARNEAENIGWVLRRLPAFVDEVVLVDGRSMDATVAVARAARPDIVVVTDNGRGKGDAMRAGAAVAKGSIVVMMDADGSMDPEEIERFVVPLTREYDFVKGSRFLEGGGTADMTLLRKTGHWGLLALANFLYGSRYTDLCYGFCAFRRSALEELELDADGFEIETQMVVRASRRALRVTEVPSFEYPRRFGNSQLNTFRDGWRVLRTMLRERVRRYEGRDVVAGVADELVDV